MSRCYRKPEKCNRLDQCLGSLSGGLVELLRDHNYLSGDYQMLSHTNLFLPSNVCTCYTKKWSLNQFLPGPCWIVNGSKHFSKILHHASFLHSLLINNDNDDNDNNNFSCAVSKSLSTALSVENHEIMPYFSHTFFKDILICAELSP